MTREAKNLIPQGKKHLNLQDSSYTYATKNQIHGSHQGMINESFI